MRLILFLLLIHNLMAQPGPVQTTEQGISNYQIQATDPTTTPLTGKQYLFNSNNVLSTKDSLNNIQRVNKDYNNQIKNFDMEQGILPYVFTAARAILNTATPLEGLRSIDFDATALNDFIETPLITIPRILMGNTCMARINIKGGDANLQFQVVNGAGSVIQSGQFATPFVDSTPQHLVFACPTQAEITATPALGQMKIRIVQTTATNAALATLDMFYLGELDAQTMAVTEGVEELRLSGPAGQVVSGAQRFWFNTTAKNTISNCANIVLGTSINAGFSYTGKSSCLVNFYLSSLTDIADGTAEIYAYLNGVALSGISRNQNAGSTRQMTSNSSGSLTINAGDILTFGSGGVSAQQPFLILTATPLSQIATVVPTTQTRAGFWAGRIWNSGACSWTSTTSQAFGDFPAVAGCGTLAQTPMGFAIPDVASNGQLPQLTVSSLKKGKYRIVYTGYSITNTSAQSCAIRFATDGTPLISTISGNGSSSASSGDGSFTLFLDVPVDRAQTIIKTQLTGLFASTNCILSSQSISPQSITMYYEPDLSDSTEGILVNKMLPIVQGTETVSQQYLSTGFILINGDFAFPAATYSKNDGALFTTTGNRITAIKAMNLKANALYRCTTTGSVAQPQTEILCTIGGVERTFSGLFMPTSGSGNWASSAVAAEIILSPNDFCRITVAAAQCNGNFNSTVNITATSFGKPGVITSDAVVTSSAGTTARKMRVESCQVNNAGTASLGSSACNGWVQSTTRYALGKVRLTLIPGVFSSIQTCMGNRFFPSPGYTGNAGGYVAFNDLTNAQIEYGIYDNSGVSADYNGFITCTGIQ